MALRDHWFDVPLDHAAPGGETIRIYAREVVAADKVDDDNLPWLVFLQGGPGGKSPRPASATGWIGRAVKDFRVLLLDQRGTGRSTPVTHRTILRRGTPEEQAEYLAHFRADSIVADAELVRRALLGDGQWSVLGQSFGGYCALTYLSFAPGGLAGVYLTGGLAPIDASAEDVYELTYERVRQKNEAFHAAFPEDRARLEAIADHLRADEVRLPDGSPLSVRRLQALGLAFGARSGVPPIHYLLEEAFIDGPDGPELSDTFLHGVQEQLSLSRAPLFAVVHELCYAQGKATRWAAHRMRPDEFDPDASPLLFTGEMIYPWMFDDDPVLRPFRDAAHLLAERSDWPMLYDREALGRNEVPVAAALYTEDMYVEATFSERTAHAIRGLRVWKTNAYEHDGLRETDYVLDRLIRMARGEL
ncbi:alpha/beta fold hydrolase [Phytoactinopolyspora endophytica]|uniref:alpha/beta fold hydrolase n=1 Tax=Phytoactinopolyspora endophytica TaxID=1642495 RepID=UPI001F0E52A8|nr:alpha/beta fold hydrolase [Phytoactinopolyspora endophytica]